jgi:hypothetical protein
MATNRQYLRTTCFFFNHLIHLCQNPQASLEPYTSSKRSLSFLHRALAFQFTPKYRLSQNLILSEKSSMKIGDMFKNYSPTDFTFVDKITLATQAAILTVTIPAR